ncbi:osteoclast-stimulating factor 1-like isoform X3 [Limulus polyphemus]|uniref:Osteoclast-stimulating factor 1 n=1 Tax=Limulus polyphemus TaxID=6850 RepID=A0ABM1TCG3_LIMPO|nr:osteoclast-stimulating factor 1-like isoform X3 [Limulus polyphemus]XP_022253570.1 osteoclast-stimulating factor 1-like isoform X3 [Limulus polyphemus]XP_022253571.1 osteoclast-stimulating factor 1-like isoform X3 [Limulus polyphemus]
MAKLLRAAPTPPKPAPKPGQVKVVRALYRYSAQQPDELSFEEGDILYILDMITDPNWWKASCDGKVGLIPSNYVEDNTEEVFHPLHEAAKRGNLSFLLDCLANKVSVNGLDKAGCTPLHWAAHGGHEDCVQEILRVPSVQINVQNKLGDTPLHSASWRGSDNIVRLLLDNGEFLVVLNYDFILILNLTCI